MITKDQVHLVALISVGVCVVGQHVVAKRLVAQIDRERARYKRLNEGTQYLLSKLEENDVEISDFDLIALTAIMGER